MKKTLLTVSLFFCFVFLQLKGYSQNGLKKGEVVQNLAIKKTLNSSTSQGALKGLQKKNYYTRLFCYLVCAMHKGFAQFICYSKKNQ